MNDVNRQYAEVLMELNENGYLDTAYTYGNERLSADRFEESSYYYLYEGRGSVSAVTGTDGYFTASYRYNAYGEMTFGKPQYENVYGYNGESYNPNLDGQYLRARYYHVETADFFTEDSYLGDISEPLSLNRYNYVYSSYLNYVDSSGNRIDDALTYRQFTNELNRVQTSKSYQQSLDTLSRGFNYIARKVEQAQGKSVVLTCNISKSAKQAIDQVNWSRVAQGGVQAFLAASVVAVGVTATVATGGLAGAAIAGIAAGSGVSTVGVAAIGTFMAGSAVTVMGAADVLEGGTDIFHGFRGSDEESVHLIRDNIQYFRDNPDSYYLLEAMLGTVASAGTTALSPFIVKNDGQDNGYDEDTYGLSYQAGRGVSRGGRHEPTDLREKLAMEEVMSNPKKGMSLEGKNTDPRWPVSEGWEKWVQNVNGIEIHYQYNPLTGEFDDVKIK